MSNVITSTRFASRFTSKVTISWFLGSDREFINNIYKNEVVLSSVSCESIIATNFETLLSVELKYAPLMYLEDCKSSIDFFM